MQRVEHAAENRQPLAAADAQIALQGHKPHTAQAEKRRREMVPVRPPLADQPPEKRHKHAIRRREKGILPRRGVHKAIRLHGIGQVQAHTHARPAAKIAAVEPAQAPDTDKCREHGRTGKADGQQPQCGHGSKRVLHDRERAAPQERCRDQGETAKAGIGVACAGVRHRNQGSFFMNCPAARIIKRLVPAVSNSTSSSASPPIG